MRTADEIAERVAQQQLGPDDEAAYVVIPDDPGLAASRRALEAIKRDDEAAFLEAILDIQEASYGEDAG